MLNGARSYPVTDNDGEKTGAHTVIWEGMFTHLITMDLRFPMPYYTKIRTALVRMGCIRQLRRGGGGSPSQWELIYEPTLEAYERQQETKVPKQTKDAQNEALILELSRRLSEMEEWQQGVNDLLGEHFGTEQVS